MLGISSAGRSGKRKRVVPESKISMSKAGKTVFEIVRRAFRLTVLSLQVPDLPDDLEKVKAFKWRKTETEIQATARILGEKYIDSLKILPESLSVFDVQQFPLELKVQSKVFKGAPDLCIACNIADSSFPMFDLAALIISLKTPKTIELAASQPQVLLETLAIKAHYGNSLPCVVTDFKTGMHIFVPGDGREVIHLMNKQSQSLLTLEEGIFAIRNILKEQAVIVQEKRLALKILPPSDEEDSSEDEFMWEELRGLRRSSSCVDGALLHDNSGGPISGGGADGGVTDSDFVEATEEELELYRQAKLERKFARREAKLRSVPLVRHLESLSGCTLHIPRYVC